AGGGDVELLPCVLSDVGDDQATLWIERVAPRVAQAVRPDLGQEARLVHERIVVRYAVWTARPGRRIDIDAQHFAEHGVVSLSVAVRIVVRAAVAEADVEIAVRSEHE